MGNLIIDVGRSTPARPTSPRCSTGSSPTPVRRYEDLAWFCIRAWRFGAPRELGAGGLGSIEDFLAAYETRRRCRRRPGRVALVAGARDTAMGRHLPLPGPAAPVRPDAIGRTGRDRPSGQRNGVRPADTCLESVVTDLHNRPTAAELVAAVAEFLETDVRDGTDGCGQLPRPRRGQRAAHRRTGTARRHRRRTARSADRSGFADERELSAAIRRGDLDDRGADVLPALRGTGAATGSPSRTPATSMNSRSAAPDPRQPGGLVDPGSDRRRRAPRSASRPRRRGRSWCRAPRAPSRRRTRSRICASLTCGPKPRPASDSASTCSSPPGRSAECRLAT